MPHTRPLRSCALQETHDGEGGACAPLNEFLTARFDELVKSRKTPHLSLRAKRSNLVIGRISRRLPRRFAPRNDAVGLFTRPSGLTVSQEARKSSIPDCGPLFGFPNLLSAMGRIKCLWMSFEVLCFFIDIHNRIFQFRIYSEFMALPCRLGMSRSRIGRRKSPCRKE